MHKSTISFFYEDINFKLLNKDKVKLWLLEVAKMHHHHVSIINYIFCSDDYLLNINKTYLNHDYYTDILTFDQSDNDEIEADIFISIDRVRENAEAFHHIYEKELNRVMVHGLLHLLGYNDQTEEEKQAMRETEEACLSLPQLK